MHPRLVVVVILAALLAPTAHAQSPYHVASVPAAGAPDKSADPERVLTFGPATLTVRGPEAGQLVLVAAELDRQVQLRVPVRSVVAWVAKADALLQRGRSKDPLPSLKGERGGSLELGPVTSWGAARFELIVTGREKKRKVTAELTTDEMTALLATLRTLAPAKVAPEAKAEAARPPEPPKVLGTVDRPVAPKSSNRAPVYPPMLRGLGVGGEVVVRLVVDATGRVERNSIEVVRASDERLVRPVRDAVSSWRFVPAEADGKRVRQLIELPFVFSPEP
jgi:TonB family protein